MEAQGSVDFVASLCPACVIHFANNEGTLGDEPHSYVVDGVNFILCEEHEGNTDPHLFFNAAQVLRNAHRNCQCRNK